MIGLALGATCGGCGGRGGATVEPPQPPLAGSVEPPVAERIAGATRAVREQPGSAAAWGRLGEVYDANDLEPPALQCYARAAERDPRDWRWPYLAGLLLRPADPVAALERFARAAELRPDYLALQVHLAFGYYLAERYDDAGRHWRRALELDPECVDALLGLARVAVARRRPADALAPLERAVTVAPAEGAVHMHLARVYRELGRRAEADLEEQRTAESPRPARQDGFAGTPDPVRDDVLLREGVGSAQELGKSLRLLAEGRDREAAEAVARALRADPDSVPALVAAARLQKARGDLAGARERIERALALDGESFEAHMERAELLARAGDIPAAIAALERALEIEPKLALARSNLAGLYARTGRAPEAIAMLREAATDLPADFDIHLKLATLLAGAGRPREALEPLEVCGRLRPDDAGARALRARVLAGLGRGRAGTER